MVSQFISLVTALCMVLVLGPAVATTVWTGSAVTFTKAPFANPTLASNQDSLTSNVALTRGNNEGLYNAVLESSYSGAQSPVDTEWAFAGLNGNPSSGVTAANFAVLNFSGWAASLGGPPNLQGNIVGRSGVVHLITDDIYLNITFTSWAGGNNGGGFAYTRSSPDTDGDGVRDGLDNCTLIANPIQCDSDGDGYGNRCDADLNNNGVTNAFDTPLFRQQIGQPSVAPTYNIADLNCNGSVNSFDTPLFRSLIGLPPGPSGLQP
jgi:hypothetical protein